MQAFRGGEGGRSLVLVVRCDLSLSSTALRSLCLSEGANKSAVSGSIGSETTVKLLPSQLLRKWRKAGRILNVANALGKIQAKSR